MSQNIRTIPLDAKLHLSTQLSYEDTVSLRQALYNATDEKTLCIWLKNMMALVPDDKRVPIYAQCLAGAGKLGHNEVQAQLLIDLDYLSLSSNDIDDIIVNLVPSVNTPLLNLLYIHPGFMRDNFIRLIEEATSYNILTKFENEKFKKMAIELSVDPFDMQVAIFNGIYKGVRAGRLGYVQPENAQLWAGIQISAFARKDQLVLEHLADFFLREPFDKYRLGKFYREACLSGMPTVVSRIRQNQRFNEEFLNFLALEAFTSGDGSFMRELLQDPLMSVERFRSMLSMFRNRFPADFFPLLLDSTQFSRFHSVIRNYLETDMELLSNGLASCSPEVRTRVLMQFSGSVQARLVLHEFRQSGYLKELAKGAVGAVAVITALSYLSSLT